MTDLPKLPPMPQQPPPITVQAQPLPVQIAMELVDLGKESAIVLMLTTALGTHSYFIPTAVAQELGADMVRKANAGASGLTVIEGQSV